MAKNGVSKTVRVVANSTSPIYDTLYKNGDRPGGGGGGVALSYSGTLADGSTLSISTDGTYNFGVRANAKPMYLLDPGKNGTWATDSRSRKTIAGGDSRIVRANQSIVTDVKAPGSNYALKNLFVPSGANNKVQASDMGGPFDVQDDGGGQIFTVFAKRRLNFSGQQAYAMSALYSGSGGGFYNFKWWRCWTYPQPGGAWNGQPDFVISNNEINGEIHTAHFTEMDGHSVARKVADFPAIPNRENFGYNKDEWTTELLFVKQSSAPDVSDGFVRYRANQSIWNTENTITQVTGNSGQFRKLFMPQFEHGYTTDLDWAMWWDIVSVDDSGMCVVITDRPTWLDPTTTVLELQPTSAWGAQQIQVTLRLGSLLTFAGKYLYIFKDGTILNESGLALA